MNVQKKQPDTQYLITHPSICLMPKAVMYTAMFFVINASTANSGIQSSNLTHYNQLRYH